MTAMHISLLFLAAVAQQEQGDGAVRKLVDQLASESVQVREHASEKLIALGPSALPALRAIPKHAPAEVFARARQLIKTIERLEREYLHDKQERERAVIPENERQSSVTEHVGVDTQVARLSFYAKRFEAGIILVTSGTPFLKGQLQWDVSAVKDKEGKELPIERCAKCSPHWLFVRTEGPIKAKVRGVLRWQSRYTLNFPEPKNGDTIAVGHFTVQVAWPELLIRSTNPLPKDVMRGTGDYFTFEFERIPGIVKPLFVQGRSTLKVGGRRTRLPRKHWCLCLEGPRPELNTRPELLNVSRATTAAQALEYPLDKVTRIEFEFRKPIEEAFEITGPLVQPQDK